MRRLLQKLFPESCGHSHHRLKNWLRQEITVTIQSYAYVHEGQNFLVMDKPLYIMKDRSMCNNNNWTPLDGATLTERQFIYIGLLLLCV
jgi:hypothetical protein